MTHCARSDGPRPTSLSTRGAGESPLDEAILLMRVRRQLRRIGRELRMDGVALERDLVAGKMLRARLVLAAAACGGARAAPRAVSYAAAIEVVHAGALLHDDVVDASPERRGAPTVVASRGARAATSLGLWLLLHGLECFAGAPARTRRMLARTLRDVARGQTDELADLCDDAVSPEAYLRRIYGKTGALYEIAARLGAHAAQLDERSEHALARSAARLRCAFQLVDDVRDELGTPELGRDPGTDLRQGVLTYPLLLVLSGACRGGDELRALLSGRPSATVRDQCAVLLRRSGALQATLARATRLVAMARRELARIAAPARSRMEEVARAIRPGRSLAKAARMPAPAHGGARRRSAPARAQLREPAAAIGARGGDGTEDGALRVQAGALIARMLRLSINWPLQNRIECLERVLQSDALDTAGDAGRDALVCAAAMLSLLRAISEDRPGMRDRPVAQRRIWMRDAELVSAIDLLYAQLVAILATVPGGGARFTRTLRDFVRDIAADTARRQTAAADSPRRSGIPFGVGGHATVAERSGRTPPAVD